MFNWKKHIRIYNRWNYSGLWTKYELNINTYCESQISFVAYFKYKIYIRFFLETNRNIYNCTRSVQKVSTESAFLTIVFYTVADSVYTFVISVKPPFLAHSTNYSFNCRATWLSLVTKLFLSFWTLPLHRHCIR